MELVIVLLIGGAAGWLAGMIFRGSGLGILGNIIVGILGGTLGYWLLGHLGIYLGNGWVGTLCTSTIGAVVILFLASLVFRKKKFS